MILRRDGESSIFIDAVLAGKDFYTAAGNPPPTLPVPVEGFLIPMAEMIISRGRETHHRITVEGLNYPKHRFNSTLVRRKNETCILVHYGLNFCNTRFAIALELAGILMGIDNPQMKTGDILQHLSGLRAGITAKRDTALYLEALAQLIH